MKNLRFIFILFLFFTLLFQERNIFSVELKEIKFQRTIPREIDSVPFKTLPVIAVDNSKNVYVVDNLSHTIYKFDKNGNFVKKIGQKGEGPGDLYLPIKITIQNQNLFVKDNISISIFDLEGKFVNRFRIFWSIVSFTPCEDLILIVSGDFEKLVNLFNMQGKLLKSFGNKYNIDYSLYKGWPESYVSEMIHHGKIMCANKYVYFVSFLFGEIFKYDFNGNLLMKGELQGIPLSKKNRELYFKKGIKLNERWEFSPWHPVLSDAYICNGNIYLLLSPFVKDKIEIWQLNSGNFEIQRRYLLECPEKISIADRFVVIKEGGEEIFYISIWYKDYFSVGEFR